MENKPLESPAEKLGPVPKIGSSSEHGAEFEPARELEVSLPETGETSSANDYQPQDIAQLPDQMELQQQVEQIVPLPEEEKLSHLKIIAKDKGLEKAIAVVKKMDDPWLEDKFHDDLMDDTELRAQLESLGKIEKL